MFAICSKSDSKSLWCQMNPDNDDMMTQQNKIIQKTFEVTDLNST